MATSPSDSERNAYFAGLYDNPRMVAHNRPYAPENEWRLPVCPTDSGYVDRKGISNVGYRHPIVAIYSERIRPGVLRALSKIDGWLCVDVLRIGFVSYDDHPVVILITVRKDSVTQPQGQEVVDEIRQVLTDNDLHDVQVEIKEDVSPPAADKEIYKISYPSAPFERIPRTGQSLGLDSPNASFSASFGLYVDVSKRGLRPEQYALTCQHCVFPRSASTVWMSAVDGGDSAPFRATAKTPKFDMEQPSSQDTDHLRARDLRIIEAITNDIENLAKKDQEAREGLCEPLSKRERESWESSKKKLQERRNSIKSIDSFSRLFGNVDYTSGAFVHATHGNFMDWALIRLDKDRFNKKALNQLPDMTRDFHRDMLHEATAGLKGAFRDFQIPYRMFVTTQAMPASEIFNPSILTYEDGTPTLRVFKYGRSTHWTVGVSNEIPSDCHREDGSTTREWCIVPFKRFGRVFSEPGDSGSAVFDFQGRVAGIINEDSHRYIEARDVTYVTPIQWVFEDIEKQLGQIYPGTKVTLPIGEADEPS